MDGWNAVDKQIVLDRIVTPSTNQNGPSGVIDDQATYSSGRRQPFSSQATPNSCPIRRPAQIPMVKLYGMASGECGRLLRESDGKSGYGLAGLVGVILVLFDMSFHFRLSQRVSPTF
jgi:hypothetical protein